MQDEAQRRIGLDPCLFSKKAEHGTFFMRPSDSTSVRFAIAAACCSCCLILRQAPANDMPNQEAGSRTSRSSHPCHYPCAGLGFCGLACHPAAVRDTDLCVESGKFWHV